MAIDRLNNVNSVHFMGRKKSAVKNDVAPEVKQGAENQPKKGFMSKLSGPVAAAMFMIPVATTTLPSCQPQDTTAYAEANATVIIPGFPPSNNDTVIINDTIIIPQEFEFPQEIQDSLNIWRGDFLDVELEGDDEYGDFTDKALLSLRGERNWDYDKPEEMTLNLQKCRDDEAVYDHVSDNSLKTELRVSAVNPNEIVIVKKDGTETDAISGLMFNDDGRKVFAHSNGKDKIYIYPKALDGENAGKYVELGTIERGYLPPDGGTPNTQYGKNVLLKDILSEGSEEHFIRIDGSVMDVGELRAIADNIEDGE